jgi:hypothetical protein
MTSPLRRFALLLALAVAPMTVAAQPATLTEAQKEAVQKLIHGHRQVVVSGPTELASRG